MVGRETKRKKNTEQKNTEDGIVKSLAKNGLIDKDKVGSLFKKKSSKKKETKKARPPLLALIHPPTLILILIPRPSPQAPLAMTREKPV